MNPEIKHPFRGGMITVREMADLIGVTKPSVFNSLKKGMSMEDIYLYRTSKTEANRARGTCKNCGKPYDDFKYAHCSECRANKRTREIQLMIEKERKKRDGKI